MGRKGVHRLCLIAATVVLGSTPETRAQGVIANASFGPILVRGMGNRDFGWRAGGSVEVLNGPLGLGGGVDFVHLLGTTKTFDGGRGRASSPSWRGATASLTATFYFGGTVLPRRIRPFFTTGLTFLLSKEPYASLDVGGGFDWWAGRKTGLRFEVRGQYPSMLSFRAGVVFR